MCKILTEPKYKKILAEPKLQNTGGAQNAKYWRVQILAVRPLKNDLRLAKMVTILAKPKNTNTDRARAHH